LLNDVVQKLFTVTRAGKSGFALSLFCHITAISPASDPGFAVIIVLTKGSADTTMHAVDPTLLVI
jgi:hypothetical protein